jgi:hypothetical protein
MAVAFLVALRGLTQGRQQETEETDSQVSSRPPEEEPDTDLYTTR